MMQRQKKRIFVLVGTSMRAVESRSSQNTLNPFDGWTNKFVFLPHEFTIHVLITKPQTPKSTLLMMVSVCDLMKSI
jgi:S-adenosylmethionine:tRNA ribosyltransferase-isomerase